MSYLDSFLATHWPSILTVVICFLTIITAFKILNIDFNPVVDKRINKIITVETFDSTPDVNAIHSKYHDQPDVLHDYCTTFSKKGCASAKYCVLTEDNKCVGGKKGKHGGPTYLDN